MNIYLDIDGVLVASGSTASNYADEFLRYVLEKYPETTYWLTTRCQGDTSALLQSIGHLFDMQTVELMRKIKPTTWDLAKTGAIDFSKPFLWFDDNLFFKEKQDLINNNAMDNWIEVNLSKDPDSLAKFLKDFPIPV